MNIDRTHSVRVAVADAARRCHASDQAYRLAKKIAMSDVKEGRSHAVAISDGKRCLRSMCGRHDFGGLAS